MRSSTLRAATRGARVELALDLFGGMLRQVMGRLRRRSGALSWFLAAGGRSPDSWVRDSGALLAVSNHQSLAALGPGRGVRSEAGSDPDPCREDRNAEALPEATDLP